MYRLSWHDIETYLSTCVLALCTVSLATIYVFVIRRCEAIFMTGDDCGVGLGWVGLAVGFFVMGVFSVWKLYRLVGIRAGSERPETM
jgi:hypothetical protein